VPEPDDVAHITFECPECGEELAIDLNKKEVFKRNPSPPHDWEPVACCPYCGVYMGADQLRIYHEPYCPRRPKE